MGGDGGCINTRADMVKTRGYGLMRGQNCGGMGITPSIVCRLEEDRIGKLEKRKMQLQYCAASQALLRDPVVVDRLGNLINKEALMEGLLSKSLRGNLSHIRSLKDVKDVKLTRVDARLVCPITKRELDDGGCRSVALWICGCILEFKALDAAGKTKCPVCGALVGEIMYLAPDAVELEDMQARIPKRKRKRPQEDGEDKNTKAKKENDDEKKKEKEKEKATTTTIKTSKCVAKLFTSSKEDVSFSSNRDGFGCPAYVRRN